MSESRECGGCGTGIEKPYEEVGDLLACSARCVGIILAEKQVGKVEKPKSLQVVPQTQVAGVVPFELADADKLTKSTKHPGWGRVKFERNVFIAEEVTILVRVAEDSEWRVFGNMKKTYAYTDPRLGLLLRTSTGSVRRTFNDIPRAVKIAKTNFKRRHKEGREEMKVERQEREHEKRMHELKVASKQVEGASYGNVAQDNKSKRFFLLEGMLKGGTPKEMVERADSLAAKAGAYSRGEIKRTIPDNPANIRSRFGELVKKWSQSGIKGKVVEKDGIWRVEVVKP